jgi:hypothetical protein
MKHINEFEEFDPNDFEDFVGDQKDLKNLGFQIPIEGEDWGFGPDLNGKNDGKTPLYLSQMVIDLLTKKGVVGNIFNGDHFFLSGEGWNMLNRFSDNKSRDGFLFNEVDFYKVKEFRFGMYFKFPKDDQNFYVCWIGEDDSHEEKEFPLGKNSRFHSDLNPVSPPVVKMIYDFIKSKIEEK